MKFSLAGALLAALDFGCAQKRYEFSNVDVSKISSNDIREELDSTFFASG